MIKDGAFDRFLDRGILKMMLRTHVVIAVLAILFFLPHVTHKIIFGAVALGATLLPDIDSGFSTAGRMKASRFFQLFIRHRGFVHSLSFCLGISLVLAVFLPVIALPFFVGFSLHIFADSFTIDGIQPFWPYRKTSTGTVKTGSLFETGLFLGFILADIFVGIVTIKGVF